MLFLAFAILADEPVNRPDEKHLKNVTQLTFGGENAEAYFDPTGKWLSFQSRTGNGDGAGEHCDAIYVMGSDGKNRRMISPDKAHGGGRTTCSFIRPDGKIIYSSTHGHGPGCLVDADMSKGYVWKVYPEMDIYLADSDGKNAKVLFQSPGYDAETTVCHKDGRMVFTSSKDGDLEIYAMNADGSNVKRLTNSPGYDGGAFWSEDCTKIVWRAARVSPEEAAKDKELLKDALVRPTQLEIFVADISSTNDLSNIKQVTHLGKASFAPYMQPDGDKHILFASNVDDPKGRLFDIYRIEIDPKTNEPKGGGTRESLERITTNPSFDGFPMFSPDGKKLVFSSNRNGSKPGETNVFIADWVE
jgi:Tol biopolymer transport system component